MREALRQLESEGLVQSRTGLGTIVSIPTRAEATELYEVRAELEGMAASLFASRATQEERDELVRALNALESAASSPIDERADRTYPLAQKDALYETLARGSHNELLSHMLAGLHRRVTQLRMVTLSSPGRTGESIQEIRVIVDAILRGDADRARDLARSHVERAAEIALASIQDSETVAAG